MDYSGTAYKSDGPPLFVSSPSFPSRSEGKEGEENGESGAPVCRLSLNNPHTAVWGISEFQHCRSKSLAADELAKDVGQCGQR